MNVLLVMTTLPDAPTAERIAAELVTARLAACVNVLAPVRSVYRWKGAVETADEVPLLIKTTRERYSAVETALRAAHPYELPEIVALPVAAGLAPYLAWVAGETQPEGPS
jgi:periplasmic divalent cation tolerance protein